MIICSQLRSSRYTSSASGNRDVKRSPVPSNSLLLALGFLLLVVVTVSAEASTNTWQSNAPIQRSEGAFDYAVYLPIIQKTDSFTLDLPIWAHAGQPAAHEVALFYLPFNLSEPLSNANLHLFADTRYQAWLDGAWLGRGPARFMRTYREYDVLELGSLLPGEHTLAVLVQWAPEDRRSESVRPMLQGHLEGLGPTGQRIFARSGTGWQAVLSSAWQQDPAPIHTWNLIGPTELLDLSELPANWMNPSDPYSTWPSAVIVDPYVAVSPLKAPTSQIIYRPRSIAFLADQPVNFTLLDAGWLSLGMKMAELPAGTPGGAGIFRISATTVFTLETLSEGAPPPNQHLVLDGSTPPWQAVGPTRPDVYQAIVELSSGQHILGYNPPAGGLTLAFSIANLSSYPLDFQQNNNAGRRILLADYASDPGAVTAPDSPIPSASLSLRFDHPATYAVLDLGRVTLGRLTATVNGPAGTVIDIGWDERLLDGTLRPLPYRGSLFSTWNQVDSWTLDGTSRTLTTLDARCGRYLVIAVWGPGPVWLEEVQVHAEGYPLTQQGSFSSSDPLLDQIWQVGADTVKLNMSDAYADPWRERGQWWGDSFVVDQVNTSVFGDTTLLRRGLLFMNTAFEESLAPALAPHNNNHQMLDYAMLWVHSLASYTTRSADANPLLNETYPTLRRFMDDLAGFENPGTGLLDLPQTHWSETAYIESLAYHSRYGQSTALNALYYGTLLQAAQLAAQVGDEAQAAAWQQQAEAVRSSLNELLYVESEGRYLTNIYQGMPYPPTPQAQAWALAYGLPPEGSSDAVAAALVELLSPDPSQPNIEIYGFYWVLEALGQSGHDTEALELIKDYYGRMLDLGATTWWEWFTSDQRPAQALSHGWGSAPTWFLTTYVLGARQVGPDEWLVKPSFDGLDFASGTIPMPQGMLQVTWHAGACAAGGVRSLDLQIEAPPGTRGQVYLPLGALLVNVDGIGTGNTEMSLSEGEHMLTFEMRCTP